MDFDTLARAVEAYHPNPDLDLLRRAYEFAHEKHKGQVRASGEPYFTHLISTAMLVAELKLDVPSIAAGLLHDTIEDCNVTREEIDKEFGPEVGDIVEGVSKLTRIRHTSREEEQAENFRKMLVAMAKDIRVILVKLCDRLHNMRTLQFLSEEKQRRMARETQEIYAPLANRLGIHWLKSELEDQCLLYLRPEIHKQLADNFQLTNEERAAYIERTCKGIAEILDKAGVSAMVKGRSKHFYSVWQKMDRDKLSFDEVHDVIGFRVIVPTLRACYETLGVVHASWKPIPGRFKDYIAMPKPNMYQSLHTTVIGPEGRRIEIQIRTPEMHRIAEEGIAAHWRYKTPGQSTFDLQWVKELVDSQQYLKNPDEFIQSVKGELFPDEVFVFTPKGDLIRLPYGSSPIDFAYAIHTDVGHRTTGARVNGKLVPLSHKLENGDAVEVITAKQHVPNKDWLGYVVSSKAKQRIRAFVKSEEHARAMAVGIEMLSKDLRKVKQSLKTLEKEGKILEVAQHMGLKGEGDLYAGLGYGRISSTKILARVLPDELNLEEKLRKKEGPLERIFQRAAKASRQKVGVKVSGMDEIVLRFAQCCEPLPGDRIVGFVTRGRGVTIHNADCAQVMHADPLRRVDVQWDVDVKAPRKVKIELHAQDQIGLLAKVTAKITEAKANIYSAQVKTTSLGKATISFEISIDDANQLERIKRALEMVPGVIKVERVRHLSASVSVDEAETEQD